MLKFRFLRESDPIRTDTVKIEVARQASGTKLNFLCTAALRPDAECKVTHLHWPRTLREGEAETHDMIAQIPFLDWGARQSPVDSSRSDTVEMTACAKARWLKTRFTLSGHNASSCEMADLFSTAGLEPSEKAGPERPRWELKCRTWPGCNAPRCDMAELFISTAASPLRRQGRTTRAASSSSDPSLGSSA